MDVFVFGSNLAGKHGKGSALHAKKFYGAVQGVGQGRMGASYAIPTKDEELRTLPLTTIAVYVQTFLLYAQSHPELKFHLVAIGCGLAGYQPDEIAPMFIATPPNVLLPFEFKNVGRRG